MVATDGSLTFAILVFRTIPVVFAVRAGSLVEAFTTNAGHRRRALSPLAGIVETSAGQGITHLLSNALGRTFLKASIFHTLPVDASFLRLAIGPDTRVLNANPLLAFVIESLTDLTLWTIHSLTGRNAPSIPTELILTAHLVVAEIWNTATFFAQSFWRAGVFVTIDAGPGESAGFSSRALYVFAEVFADHFARDILTDFSSLAGVVFLTGLEKTLFCLRITTKSTGALIAATVDLASFGSTQLNTFTIGTKLLSFVDLTVTIVVFAVTDLFARFFGRTISPTSTNTGLFPFAAGGGTLTIQTVVHDPVTIVVGVVAGFGGG